YLEEHARETQTALETDHFAVCFKQDRIDENNRAARSVGGHDVDNHQLLGDPDLRSCKSNAVVGIHGIEHVLSQLANGRIEPRHLLGWLEQNIVWEVPELKFRHKSCAAPPRNSIRL